MKTHLISVFWAVIVWAGLSAVQAAVSDPVSIDKADPVVSCLPTDIGEKAVLWLESDDRGGLHLHCEKHAQLGYGMAQIPVPVSVE